MSQKVTDEQLRTEHATGDSCNAIAKRLGVQPSTVSRRCAALGLTFNTAHTAKAVKSHQERSKVRRARLQAEALKKAREITKQAGEKVTRWQWDAKTAKFVSLTAELEPAQKRDLSTAARNFASIANDIARLDEGNDNTEKAKSMLSGLFDSLKEQHAKEA